MPKPLKLHNAITITYNNCPKYKLSDRLYHIEKQKVTPNKPLNPCSGCGSTIHGQKGANDRPTKFPAWGKIYQNCQKLDQFAHVCRQKESGSANALIAHVNTYDDYHHVYEVSSANNTEEIPAFVSTTIPPCKNNSPIELHIFPDSGTSICLAGANFLQMKYKNEYKKYWYYTMLQKYKRLAFPYLPAMGCSQWNLTLVHTLQYKMFLSVIKSIVYFLVKQVAKKLISYCYVFPIPCHPNQALFLPPTMYTRNHPPNQNLP